MKSIIVDIDGTLALMNGKRDPYDWSSVGLDDPNQPIIDLVKMFKHQLGYNVIIMSGRDGQCLSLTRQWLNQYGVPYDRLLMRATKDFRKDSLIKKELYQNVLLADNPDLQVDYVIDDRQQVVDMWRDELGLTVLQVAKGDF
tara:strand:- start:60 stop:485 length:426 start_codon:yes stop_codon:yes gene_type:complete